MEPLSTRGIGACRGRNSAIGPALALALLACPAVAWPQAKGSTPGATFGPLRLDFGARVQLDGRTTPAREDESDVDLSRKRVTLKGSLGADLEFEVETEIADDRPWRDVFVDYRPLAALRAQAGHFKLPFGLEATTGATRLDFVARSRAGSLLAPGRDWGAMAHGRLWRKRLAYEVGGFAGQGQGAPTWAARVASSPFAGTKGGLADLHVGVAVTNEPTGGVVLRARTALGEDVFPTAFNVAGRRRRMGLEARWRPGPVSVAAEFVRVADDRRGQAISGDDLSPLVAQSWYVSGTWAVTGERKARGLDRPRRPFLHGGVGAIELAGRFERVTFGGGSGTEPASLSPRA
ncbi:MAG TPA: porin, partial [Vicinamibacterales bacterium]